MERWEYVLGYVSRQGYKYTRTCEFYNKVVIASVQSVLNMLCWLKLFNSFERFLGFSIVEKSVRLQI